MNYALEDLLRVRNLRKDRASDELVKAKRKLKEAEEFCEKQREKLADFVNKKPSFIAQIYEKLIQKKHFKRNVMDGVAFKIGKLDERQTKLEINLEKAQNAMEAAKAFVEECHELLRQATVNVQKIEEHKATWKEEFDAIQQELQEKEMEDFKSKQPEH